MATLPTTPPPHGSDKDEGETKSVLKAFRENRWILLLKATLEEQVGTAHEVLARQVPAGENRQELHEPPGGRAQGSPVALQDLIDLLSNAPVRYGKR